MKEECRAYERTAARLLSLCRAPDVRTVRFLEGVRLLRGVKSKHRATMARRWRTFWRIKSRRITP